MISIEGPGAWRRVLLVLLAVAHLLWAGVLAFFAWLGYVWATEGFLGSPEPVNWSLEIFVAGLAIASVYAATLILRDRLTASRRLRWTVALISVGQLLLVAVQTWRTWPR